MGVGVKAVKDEEHEAKKQKHIAEHLEIRLLHVVSLDINELFGIRAFF